MLSVRTSWLRFSLAAALLILAAAFLELRSRAEIIAPRVPLAQFPYQIDGRIGRDQPITQDVLDVLGPGDFLMRDYEGSARKLIPVNLYIAYFQSQRTGDTIHSPKNCLPGSGWSPIQSDHISLTGPGGNPIRVNRYVLANGDQKLLALYWYQAHGRVVASEYSAKFYLVTDAMRLNRTDGSLVRIITPIVSESDSVAAEARVEQFASSIFPSLDQFIAR
jgi:EpsI family protein